VIEEQADALVEGQPARHARLERVTGRAGK
jgi:hypothetical protein